MKAFDLGPGDLRRRNFLSLAGKGLGLAALSSSVVASLLKEIHAASKNIAHLTPQQAAMDEDYWAVIQNSFSVTRGIINLNNGGVSPSHASSPKLWFVISGNKRMLLLIRCGRFSSRNLKQFVLAWPKCLAVIEKRLPSRATPLNHSKFS